MNSDNFLREIETIAHAPRGSVSLSDRVDSLPRWDSLAVIDFIAFADEAARVQVSPVELQRCITIADLYELCKNSGGGR